MRLPGEISVGRAARILGAHPNTVYRWCQAARCGEPSPVPRVRRDATGHYWLSVEDVRRILAERIDGDVENVTIVTI